MLTFRDCLDLAGIAESEVDAIARHEHIPAIVALELGNHLLRSPGGKLTIRQFVVDDIVEAQARHSCRECIKLSNVLGSFLATHPDCRETNAASAKHVAELVAIGLVGQVRETSGMRPTAARVTIDQIDDAKRRGDCRRCAKLSLLLARSPGPLRQRYSKG